MHDDHLVFAGLDLGGAVVAIQPPRGFGEDPIAVYHTPDLPAPHHYLAFYRWLDVGWGADAIVHLGKHGTLEWLPGKGAGLSAACTPDAALGDLPLLYPFAVNDPGEGTQAKRRAHAVIIDHLPPPMTRAETYDDLARVERLLDEYAKIEALDPAKLPAIQGQLWDLLVTSELARDLGVDRMPDPDDFAGDGRPHRRLPVRAQGRADPRRPARARRGARGRGARRLRAGHHPPAAGRRCRRCGRSWPPSSTSTPRRRAPARSIGSRRPAGRASRRWPTRAGTLRPQGTT